MRLMIVMGVLGGAVIASAMALHANVVRVAIGLVVGAAAGFLINRWAARARR